MKWERVIDIYIQALEIGSDEQKVSARSEVRRMATIIDSFSGAK